jgi:DNA polymerase-4
VEHATSDAATIRLAAGLCLKRVDLARRIRLLGVRVGSLQRAPGAGPARRGSGREAA